MVINDNDNSLVPLLLFELKETEVSLMQNIILSRILVNFNTSCRYFNVYKSRWEPIIENTSMLVEMANSAVSNPQNQIQLQIDQMFNINVSSAMVAILKAGFKNYEQSQKNNQQTIRRWRSSSRTGSHALGISDLVKSVEQQEKIISEHQDKRNMEFVSPYSIYNNTGYKIKITDVMDESRYYILENGE